MGAQSAGGAGDINFHNASQSSTSYSENQLVIPKCHFEVLMLGHFGGRFN